LGVADALEDEGLGMTEVRRKEALPAAATVSTHTRFPTG
jgi:hypothetical protein